MKFLKKLLDSEYKELCRFENIAKEIEALEPEMQALKDEDFKDKTIELKAMLEEGKTLDDLVVPAFALAREAARAERTVVPEDEIDRGKAALTELFNGGRNKKTPIIVARSKEKKNRRC